MRYAIAIVLLVGGCTSAPAFVCASNEACINGTVQGTCELDGACSFPDATCASNQRWGDSGASANTCTPAGTVCVREMFGGGTTECGLNVGHICAVKVDGSVVCWGDNSFGQLGVDGPSSSAALPVPLPSPASEVATAQTHSCALTADGSVYCWGDNSSSQLGVTGITQSPTPILVATAPPGIALNAGGDHTCMIAVGGDTWCWGENGDQQILTGAPDPQPTPLKLPGVPEGIETGCGDQHSCTIVADSSVYCWGSNALGQDGQGDGAPDHIETPTQVKMLFSAIKIILGDQHTCILDTSSTVSCWGSNVAGSVGNGSDMDATLPVAVFQGAAEIATSGDGKHVCAIKTADKTLWCWGNNDYGQLGTDPTVASTISSPVQVPLSSVAQVAVGAHNTCAMTVDGTMWCWGSNHSGQNGVTASDDIQFSPVRTSFSCD